MSDAYPTELYPGCPCQTCDSPTWPVLHGIPLARMSLCPNCGNKRCPGAANHANECSGSNQPRQPGSLYENTGQVDPDIAALLDQVRAKRAAAGPAEPEGKP